MIPMFPTRNDFNTLTSFEIKDPAQNNPSSPEPEKITTWLPFPSCVHDETILKGVIMV